MVFDIKRKLTRYLEFDFQGLSMKIEILKNAQKRFADFRGVCRVLDHIKILNARKNVDSKDILLNKRRQKIKLDFVEVSHNVDVTGN